MKTALKQGKLKAKFEKFIKVDDELKVQIG